MVNTSQMSDLPKKLVLATMGVSALVALASICDLAIGIPFSGSEQTRTMDVLFIISSAIVGYLGYDAFKDLR